MSATRELLSHGKHSFHEQRVKKSRVVHICSKCGAQHTRKDQRYCVVCHAAYMREWRKTHPLNPEQTKKGNCRAFSGVYKRRGKLISTPCEKCGSPRTEMHHHDYEKPLEVEWLCRPCHLAHHKAKKIAAQRSVTNPVKKSKKAA